ncbi:hypothetical protein GS502_00940 [Rhodococcus hoagii]|nr:hypothetical protein [Prescottella equi]
MISWDRLGQAQFDRVVEILIARQWRDIATVVSPDGRGGDGGIDIEVRHGSRRRIYQLKYFVDGFSGDKKSTRQRQVRNSYLAALRLDPPVAEWVLVVPSKLTPGEREFVQGLETPEGPKIAIHDRLDLDVLACDYPDVYRYLERDQMRENAQLYNREIDSLFGGIGDLTKRIGELGSIADSTDLDWGVQFSRTQDGVSCSVYPKHPQAHVRTPIVITLEGAFGPEHSAARRAMDRAVKFGASGTVVLPAETVRSVAISGPALLAGRHENVEVRLARLTQSPYIGSRSELHFLDGDGLLMATHEGEVTHMNRGTDGFALEISFYEHLHVELLFPHDRGLPGEGKISYNFRRIRPGDALGVVSLLRLLRRQGTFKVFVEANELMSLANDDSSVASSSASDEDLDFIESLAHDLQVVQTHCRTTFVMPDEVEPLDRINLRVARLLIEGHVVASPEAPTGFVTLTGTDTPELRALLSRSAEIRLTQRNFTLVFCGKHLVLGDVYAFHPHATPVNGGEVLEALDAGRAAGLKVHLRPGDDAYFNLALASRMSDAMRLQTPTAWDLPGIDQPVHRCE